MRFMVQSLQRPDLTAKEQDRLYAAMQVFYSDIPDGVRLIFDFIRADKTGSYSVLEVPDRDTMDRVMAPFEGLVNAEIIEVLTVGEAMGSA